MSKDIPVVAKENIFGNIKSYAKSPIACYDKWEKEYGNTFKFSILNRKIVYTSNLNVVKHILQGNHKNYRKNLAYRKLKLLLGEGLFTSEGEYWLRQRRQMQTFFYKEKLNHYFYTFQELTQKSIEEQKIKGKGDLLSFLTLLTLRIISKTTLNIDLNNSQVVEENLPFALRFMIDRITNPPNPPLWIPTANNRLFKKSVDSIDDYLAQLINDRTIDEETTDVLSLFLDLRKTGFEISDQQIKDELLTIFLAGQETTAVACFWLITYLHKNPLSIEKIKDEFESVLQNEEFSPVHIKSLRYTNNTIQEVLRLASPVWVVGRESIEKDEIDGYEIDAGQSVIFSPYMIHRNPTNWSNPLEFNPDRFNQEYNKAAYLPFGAGPRVCIGNNFSIMELFVFIHELFVKKNLKITSAIDHTIEFDYSLTLRPKTSLQFEFVKP